MEILFLMLGLLPLAFLPDLMPDDDTTADDDGDADPPDQSGDPGALLPDLEDNDTDPGWAGDPGDVLQPDDDDDEPVTVPDGDGEVLDPNDTPQEAYPVQGDGTLLQQLLAEHSDATAGIGFLGTQITETSDTVLGDGRDIFVLPDDGIEGTGDGELGDWDGTPLISADDMIEVVSGGTGDDDITAGDAAAFLFGGDGDDTITLGEGVAAAYGGAGADTLFGSDAVDDDGAFTAYLDGGVGDDVIVGGAAHELIEGGEHGDPLQTGDDTLSGGGGDDEIRGGYGADTLSGGDGDDVLHHLGVDDERIVAERNEFGWYIDNDPDVLDGGDGDDELYFDRADTVTGGDGSDNFFLYFDHGSGAGSAEITDFVRGEDFLRVELNPDAVTGEPTVEVGPSEDGQDGLVVVNGAVVAVVSGVPDLSLADIYVHIQASVFA